MGLFGADFETKTRQKSKLVKSAVVIPEDIFHLIAFFIRKCFSYILYQN